MRWIKKRKSTPVVFGNTVDDEAILRQRQIEEPEGEVDFSFLSGRTTTQGGIRPTGKRSLGVSGAYAPLDHEHPTALLLTSNTQSPEQRELRIDNANFLRIWDGNQWVLVEPTASNQAPLLTGTQNVGTSLKYSREDHSHPTGLLQVSHTQTPITGEIRYDSDGIKRYDGTNWILIADLTTSLDWSNITNKPTEFPVSVRKNSAAPVHTRPRLNFIEGSNITITIADDTTDNEVDITISATGVATPSDATPQLTGTAAAGTSTDYSRGDHSHPTGLLEVSNTQTPVVGEIRYDSQGIKRYDGSQWVLIADLTTSVDWSNIINKPNSFPVGVRQNSTNPTYERPRLNFIGGNNITITIADDTTDNEVDITISATGGGTPSNTTPQPTGTAAAGTSTEYSRGDHSHPTAILAQGDSQTPVNNEIRFSSNNKLVRWDGSNWVELSVESTTATPVQGTSSYGEVGSKDGEIWYRTNDRAFFFRIGGQRVYPVAALPTTAEVPSGTGAGNRILAFSTSDRRIYEMGGSSQAPLWANAVAWFSNSAPTTADTGTSLNGKLWYNYSTKRFFVYDGSGATWRKPVAITDEVVQEGNGANATTGLSIGRMFMTTQGLMYTIPSNITSPTSGYAQVPVGQGVLVPSSQMTRFTTNLLNVVSTTNGIFKGWNTTVYGEFIQSEAGSSATNQFEVIRPLWGIISTHKIRRFGFGLSYGLYRRRMILL
ncbi:MAG: hypothetical protein KatS3mg054_0583 [Chloroflexus sp.]|nr:MAG: hypothetical protein KatS3mg054_0583 [Chloroflexus sp.]